MPNVLTKDGFRFFFYSADFREPIHIYVEYGDGEAKFWVDPNIFLASSYEMKAKDLKKARMIIENNRNLIKEKWNEYFRNKK